MKGRHKKENNFLHGLEKISSREKTFSLREAPLSKGYNFLRKSLWVMCDFDHKRDTPDALKRRFRWLAGLMWGDTIMWRTFVKLSPSKRGWHFWAYPVTSPETARTLWRERDFLLMQCLMGSDVKRERMNFRRICQGVIDWNVLFSTKREKL